MSVDATGRLVLVDEDCRFCATSSRYMHPAGVVAGRWTCTRCGRRQDETCAECGAQHSNAACHASSTFTTDTEHLEGID